MKGWILLENNKPVENSMESIDVFKTKESLLMYYGDSLGELNTIKRVELIIT
jgi:hypothetical protein